MAFSKQTVVKSMAPRSRENPRPGVTDLVTVGVIMLSEAIEERKRSFKKVVNPMEPRDLVPRKKRRNHVLFSVEERSLAKGGRNNQNYVLLVARGHETAADMRVTQQSNATAGPSPRQ